MYVIAEEMFELVSGGAPTSGGNSATSGTATAVCPPNTIPIAVSGNITAAVGGVTVGGNGSFATCIPVNSSRSSGGSGVNGGGGSPDDTLKNAKRIATQTEKDAD